MNNKYISRATRRSMIIAIIIGTIGGLTAVGMFSLSGLMLSKSTYGVPLYSLMVLVATIKLFGVIRAVTRYYERLVSHEATFTMLKDIRVDVFNKLLTDFTALHTKWRLSELLERTVNDIEKMQNVLLRVIYPPVVALLTAAVVCGIYMFYSVRAVMVIAGVMIIILIILPKIYTNRMFKMTEETAERRHSLLTRLADYQQGREDLAVFDQHQRYFAALMQAKDDYEQSIKEEKQMIIRYDFMLNLFSMLAVWGVLMVSRYDADAVMYASIIMVTITLFEMAIPMTNVPFYRQETALAMQHIDEIKQQHQTDAVHVQHIFPLSMQQLNYYYPGQHRPVLKDITMEVRPGDRLGIIGASGSGKSTLLQLLAGLYESELKIGSRSMQAVDKIDYYNAINVMQQENHFFQGTVKDNLFSNDEQQINKLLKEFELPFTAESWIDEFGGNLSGGERRRLHFIRLLLRPRPLWLLDEPFNGVDIINQQRMLRYIDELNQETAVIMISHDLSVLQSFKEIYVMIDGCIAQRGNAQQLIKQLAIEKNIG